MSQLTFLYGKVGMVPPPPEALINQAYNIKKLAKQGNFYSDLFKDTPHRRSLRTLIKDGKEYENAATDIVIIDEFQDWAEDSLGQKCNDIRLTLTKIGNNMNGPHIDISRRFSLIYILEPGGKDHELCFYKEKNQNSLIRPAGYSVDNYNDLEVLAKVVVPLNQWFLLNSSILHSIENIPDGRLSIQIGFPHDPNLKYIDPVYIVSDR